MIGDRLLAASGAKLVGALAVACLALALLLIASLAGNWLQFRGSARLAAELGAKLAAAEARGRAEIEACVGTNERVVGTVQVLGDELHACRGQHQRTDEALGLALRQRDRARREAEGERRQRDEVIRMIYETDSDCRAWGDAPVCRARSDGMLGPAAERPAQ